MKSLALVFIIVAHFSWAGESPCAEELGEKRSQILVNQCLDISPATAPPCSGNNSCEVIIFEIKRGCGIYQKDYDKSLPKIPAYCGGTGKALFLATEGA
jgi:nitrogen fixation-related uncharacterized protein